MDVGRQHAPRLPVRETRYAVTEQAPSDGTMMVRLTKALAAT
jgi:hypothetical protein